MLCKANLAESRWRELGRSYARLGWQGRLALRAAFLAAALGLGGCQSSGEPDITGAIGAASAPDGQRTAEEWGRRYDRSPDDKTVALNYARALRGMSEHAQAAAILQRLSIKFPRDVEVLGAYGKALADAGQAREAAEVLARRTRPSGRTEAEKAFMAPIGQCARIWPSCLLSKASFQKPRRWRGAISIPRMRAPMWRRSAG